MAIELTNEWLASKYEGTQPTDRVIIRVPYPDGPDGQIIDFGSVVTGPGFEEGAVVTVECFELPRPKSGE